MQATDADNDPVTFALDNVPAFVTLKQINPDQRTALLRIAPPCGSDGRCNTLRYYTLQVFGSLRVWQRAGGFNGSS